MALSRSTVIHCLFSKPQLYVREFCYEKFDFPDCRGADANTSLEFTKTDMDGIALMQSKEDIFSLLVSSVCPTIYGLEMVKVSFTFLS